MVSIIIPTKNEEKNLPQLFACLRAQTFRDFELIVADADSTDATREIAKHEGAIVVHGGMPGPGRNAGAAHARGDIFLFLDADGEFPSKKFLEENIAEFKKKKCDVASVRIKPLSRKSIDRIFLEAFNAYAIAMESVRSYVTGACIFATRQMHEKIHGFDEQVIFAEDQDYAKRAVRAGATFAILRAQPIGMSMRRFEKEGHLTVVMKYLASELHMLTKGSVTVPMFEYPMGGDVDDEKT